MRTMILPLALLALTGCDEILGDTVCTTSAEPALVVTVVEDASDQLVTGALVWVEDGEFVDTLESHDGVAAGVHERPGTYGIHVEADGFAAWSREDVTVRDGECHVRTRELTARLEAE